MEVPTIDTQDISIVCQGSVLSGITHRCLIALRRVFPNAELIVSTWTDNDTVGIDADKIVLSNDPGAVTIDEVAGTKNNVNRQLVSTQAGLRVATRPYTLKTRTDILFDSSDFLSYFGRYDSIPSPYFTSRLLICNYYTRNPRVLPLCYHPSDWILFGYTEDVNKYYDALPLMPDEESRWFKSHSKNTTFFTNYISRYTPEQHIFLNFLRKFRAVDCACYYIRTARNVRQTEQALAECFIVLDMQKELQITFSKYDPDRYLEKHTLLSYRQWQVLYEHYCEEKYSLRWLMYLISTMMAWMLTQIRMMAVCILDKLGIKETIKNFLSK